MANAPDINKTIVGKDIETMFGQASKRESRGKRVKFFRGAIAYALKFTAAGGALLLGFDFFQEYQQIIGIAIPGAILIDAITSNQKRLVSEVEAGYAYKFLKLNIGMEHNAKMSPLLEKLKKLSSNNKTPDNDKEALRIHESIQKIEIDTQRKLSAAMIDIEKRRADADIKALQAISLDNERAAEKQT